MKHEKVKYNNEINMLGLGNFTATDLNLFMAICAKVKEKGNVEVSIEYSEIRKLAGFTPRTATDLTKAIKQMCDKLSTVVIESYSCEKLHYCICPLFDEFDFGADTMVLKVKIKERFEYLLNDLMTNFTFFDLDEYVALRNKLDKNLYRLLKQWRSIGNFTIKYDKYKELAGFSTTISTKEVLRKTREAIERLSSGETPSFKNLDVEVIRAKTRGMPVESLKFTFVPELPNKQCV